MNKDAQVEENALYGGKLGKISQWSAEADIDKMIYNLIEAFKDHDISNLHF